MTEDVDKDKEARFQKIREQAAKDLYALGDRITNPYPLGSDEFFEYQDGWVRAHRHSSVNRLASSKSTWDPSPEPKPYEPPPKVNEYARRKG